MFRGVANLTIDDKGRMLMPSRYRELLQQQANGQIVITIDTEERCLLLYPLPEWEVIEKKIEALPSFNAAARRVQRLLIGHATEVNVDSHGRILLPSPLRDFAGLSKHTVLIGQGKKFELWDEGYWRDKCEIWLAEEQGSKEQLPPELQNLSL